MEQVTLKVPTITCDGCVASIRKTVSKVTGVHSVGGDAAKKTVTVTYDPGLTDTEGIVAAIRKAYHRVEPLG